MKLEDLTLITSILIPIAITVILFFTFTPQLSNYNIAKETVNFVNKSRAEATTKGHDFIVSAKIKNEIDELKNIMTTTETEIGAIIIPTLSMLAVYIFSALTLWLQIKKNNIHQYSNNIKNLKRSSPLLKLIEMTIKNLQKWDKHTNDNSIACALHQSKILLLQKIIPLGHLLTNSEQKQVFDILLTLDEVIKYNQLKPYQKTPIQLSQLTQKITQISRQRHFPKNYKRL